MQDRISVRLAAILPDPGLPRRLAVQSLIYSIGSGVFVTGNIVYFTGYAGLSAGQVGLGLSIALAVSVASSVPAGRLSDRIGPLRTWSGTAIFEGLVYLCYPFVDSFAVFVAVLSVLALAESAGSAGRAAYTLGALPRETRVRALAFTRSALNLGFTIGAGACGILLALGNNDALVALPLSAGALLLANGLFVARLPAASPPSPRPATQRLRSRALRQAPFVRLALLNGVLGLHDTLLSVVLPLWVLTCTDAPDAVVAVAFVVNTVLVIAVQVPASRGADTLSGAGAVARRSGLVLALTCVVMIATSYTSGWATLAVLLLGYVLLTFAELQQAAGAWGLFAEIAPDHERGDFQGVWRLGSKSVHIAAPAALTFLAVQLAPLGWLLMAALVAVAALLVPRTAAQAARRTAQVTAADSH